MKDTMEEQVRKEVKELLEEINKFSAALNKGELVELYRNLRYAYWETRKDIGVKVD